MPYIGKSPSAGVRQRYQYTATAGQTTFTGTDLGNLTLTYTDNNFVDVFQNGVLLKGGGTDYTATSGTSVVLATGASVSDVIEIIVYDVFSVGNFFNRTDSDSRYLNVAGDTMTGSLDLNGTELVLDVDGDTSITSDTDDRVDIRIAGTDTVHIDASGIGVNINNPLYPLHVTEASGGDTAAIFIDGPTDGTSALFMGDSDDIDIGAIQYDHSSNYMAFRTNATERMRIKSNGVIMVPGTHSDTSSGERISISTTSGSTNAINCIQTGSSGTNGALMCRTTGGTFVGGVQFTNSSTSFPTSSDYRLKENIVTDWDATTRLKQLKPSRFNFKVESDTTVDGFLAHEVSSIVPEAINGEKDAVDKNGNIEPQSIDHSKLVPLLTKALQESIARADALEARIKKLEDG